MLIEIVLSGTHAVTGTAIVFYDIYAEPVTYGVSYPGVPSFSGTYSATKLNQLVDAAAWCYNRMALVPFVPGLAQVYVWRPLQVVEFIEIYRGAILRSFTADALRVQGGIYNVDVVSYKLHVYIGGSLAYSSAATGPGYLDVDLTISLSGVTVGTRAEVVLKLECITPGLTAIRYSILSVRSEGAYPYASALSTVTGYGDISATSLNTILNAYAAAITTVKSRIDSTTWIFERARAMRKWYEPVVSSRRTDAALAHRYVPRFHQRLGDIALVRGKGLKIGWGPVTHPGGEADLGYDKWETTHTETATEADTTATQTVYLDGMKGLYPGSAYFVLGGADFASEVLT